MRSFFRDFSFQISSEAKSYFFAEENITVVIPPNTLEHASSCMASIRSKRHDTPQPDALSEIYEFTPSGLMTQNRIMFVIPLYKRHSYDHQNMTLMYRENNTSDFMCADSMIDHKPTWLFHRNTCYLFLNHFCGLYVTEEDSGQNSHKQAFSLESLLFYKYSAEVLELKLTFGCYNESSECSRKQMIQVIYF